MLDPLDPSEARHIVTWATSAEEARWWGGQTVRWPVEPSVLRAWQMDPDVHSYVLREDDVLVAYGEIWVDEEEQEVELGRLIVRPERRGQGVGRLLVTLLLQQAALTGYRTAFLRVAQENRAALACYGRAGFVPVSADEQRDFNKGQPVEYVWLRRDLGAVTPPARTPR